MLNPKEKPGVILYPYLPITATSLQRPLSSVPKVAVAERLYIGLTEEIAAPLVTNRLFFRVTHFSMTGSEVYQASVISGLDVSRCKQR